MSSPQLEAKGFFAGLLDFGFTTFITLKFLRVIYIILFVLSAIGGLIVFGALASRGGASVVVGLVIGPLAALVYIVIARLYLELVAVLFRIGQNTTTLVALGGGSPQPGPGYGPPPTGYGTPPSA